MPTELDQVRRQLDELRKRVESLELRPAPYTQPVVVPQYPSPTMPPPGYYGPWC